MELSADNVTTMFRGCAVWTTGLDQEIDEAGRPWGEVQVDGIMHRFHLHEESVAARREDIASMLAQLPEEFGEDTGGGWSFLNSCNNRSGRQWTDLHLTMEQLWCLGIAAGRARYTLPRDFWEVLPGGMPYLTVCREDAPGGEKR